MKLVCIGHSHINKIKQAYQKNAAANEGLSATFIQLRDPDFSRPGVAKKASSDIKDYATEKMQNVIRQATHDASLTILCPTGNEHVAASIVNRKGHEDSQLIKVIEKKLTLENYSRWIKFLVGSVQSSLVILPPPPPPEPEDFILANANKFSDIVSRFPVSSASVRLWAWRYQLSLVRRCADEMGLEVMELPTEVFNSRGFMHEKFHGRDVTHGNMEYGQLIINAAIDFSRQRESVETVSPLEGHQKKNSNSDESSFARSASEESHHPYQELPDRSFWKQAVAQVPPATLNPVAEVPFKIKVDDRVATAGSCFAQHISKRMRAEGFTFLVTEEASDCSKDDAEKRGFYDFSARYGNIYTVRQLLQLFDRASGDFSPIEGSWALPGGRYCDPFRPRIEPNGFESLQALEEDRQSHLSAVRAMFESLDVFVFTLGLTEAWVSKVDGSVYPVAPGVAGGVYDPDLYEFKNFSVDEVIEDLKTFIVKLRSINPEAKIILTVSPVPLVATYEPSHVLVATTYSKSVLRVAADTIARHHDDTYYFPSYEIISGNYNRGIYYGPDLRSVTKQGVDHVMSVFMGNMTASDDDQADSENGRTEVDEDFAEMMEIAEAECDEELLER